MAVKCDSEVHDDNRIEIWVSRRHEEIFRGVKLCSDS